MERILAEEKRSREQLRVGSAGIQRLRGKCGGLKGMGSSEGICRTLGTGKSWINEGKIL
jgi:hypothetical protein